MHQTSDESCVPVILTWQNLHLLKFPFVSPFQIKLKDNQIFFSEKLLRLVPNKRLMALGTWQGKPVFAKIFFNAHHAQEHIEREISSIHTLKKYHISTPDVYYQGVSQDGRLHVLLMERIFNIKIPEITSNQYSPELLNILKAVISELARQHKLGIKQQDLHLDNFILTEKMIYTIDGAKIKFFQEELNRQESYANLAVFFTFINKGIEEYWEELFQHYAKQRNWELSAQDFTEMIFQFKKEKKLQWQRLKRKIFIDCPMFACTKNWHTWSMLDRKYAYPQFLNFIKNPELIIKNSSSTILKKTNDQTDLIIVLDDKKYLVKRYEHTNIWKFLLSWLRPSVAAKSWRLAQKLKSYDVLTATPIAFIENKFLGFCKKSYFVTEYVEGETAKDYLVRADLEKEKLSVIAKRIAMLVNKVKQIKNSMCYLEMNDILINQYEEPVLINLNRALENSVVPPS